jgi:NADPH-dependent 7-cyano-7-deazaguanine reductase QueF-like protein
MVESLPPSGTAPDNETIITNSNDELSVPLDGLTLDVGSSGKVEVFESTQYYLASFEDNDSGDWTGIDSVSNGKARVNVQSKSELPKSASVTADLTGIDVLTFRIDYSFVNVKIKVDEVELVTVEADGWKTVEISGLDNYGTNTTVTIEAYEGTGYFDIDYIRGNIIQSESRIVELVDTGGLP